MIKKGQIVETQWWAVDWTFFQHWYDWIWLIIAELISKIALENL